MTGQLKEPSRLAGGVDLLGNPGQLDGVTCGDPRGHIDDRNVAGFRCDRVRHVPR